MGVDPIAGTHGDLVMGGWIGEAPTGGKEVFLLLTTSSPDARRTMPVVAAALGLGGESPPPTVPAEVARVTVTGDLWLRLDVPGEYFSRPVPPEMGRMARRRGRVVLVVGTAPMPAGMDEDRYIRLFGDSAQLGLVTVVAND